MTNIDEPLNVAGANKFSNIKRTCSDKTRTLTWEAIVSMVDHLSFDRNTVKPTKSTLTKDNHGKLISLGRKLESFEPLEQIFPWTLWWTRSFLTLDLCHHAGPHLVHQLFNNIPSGNLTQLLNMTHL